MRIPALLIPAATSFLVVLLGPIGCSGNASSTGDPIGNPTAVVTMAPKAVMPNASLTATVTFSTDVTGVSAGDLSVTGGTAGAFTSVNGHTYTLAITAGGGGSTTVDVAVAAGAGTNASGEGSLAASGTAAIAYAPWASASGTDAAGTWADLTVAGHGETAIQRFRLIAPATFVMGSPATEAGHDSGGLETQHMVTLTTPYWIADTACTQQMWKAVMGADPAYFQPPHIASADLLRPVEQVSWTDTQSFLTTLNAARTDLAVRLPTEAEWENAARAGTAGPFSIDVSSRSTDAVNCQAMVTDAYISIGLYRDQTVPVKSLPVNPYGLYEIHGNVLQWCSDWFQNDLGSSPVTDPTGPTTSAYGAYVLRGGAFTFDGQQCRSAYRYLGVPSFSLSYVGFRLAAPGRPSGSG